MYSLNTNQIILSIMKSKFAILIFITIACFQISSCTQKLNTDAEKTKIESVVTNFKTFWETEDMNLHSEIMVHDADMVNYGSDANEIFIGWDALKDSIQQMLPAFEKTKITVRNQVINMDSDDHTAWFSQLWDWELEFGGQPVKIPNQRLTGVLEKRNDSWVVVQFHNSVPVTH